MRGRLVISWRRFVGLRRRWAGIIRMQRWCQPSISFRSIFTTLIGLSSRSNACDLILLLLWAMLRVGAYLILLALLAFVALRFLALWDLRFSPHSIQLPFYMRANGATGLL